MYSLFLACTHARLHKFERLGGLGFVFVFIVMTALKPDAGTCVYALASHKKG